MREHLFHEAACTRELFGGDQVHFAGGNDAIGLMRGWGPPPIAGGGTPAAQIGSSVPSRPGGASGATISNTSGGNVSLGRVQVTTAVLFLLAVGALVLLNKAGFKFSVTVG